MSWSIEGGKKKTVEENLNVLNDRNTPTIDIEALGILRDEYIAEDKGLTAYLKEQAQTYNLSGKLQETGEIQTQIRSLEKERDSLQSDVDTALAREGVLRTRNTTGNSHTLYLLDRPVRRGMVPFLWALSVLFVGVGVLFFYWLTPILLLSQGGNALGSSSVFQMFSDIFASRYTWMALFGAASIVILFLSLKVAGVFGK
jgi:hypothetical protein